MGIDMMAYARVLALLVSVSFVLQGCDDKNIIISGEGGDDGQTTLPPSIQDYSTQPSNESMASVQPSGESTAPIQQSHELAEFDQSPTPVPTPRGATSASTPADSGR